MSSTTSVQSREEDHTWRLICKARLGDDKAAADLLSDKKIKKMIEVIAVSLRRGGINGDLKSTKEFQHEIGVKLWRNIQTFKGENMKAFEKWLWKIAKNMKNDDLRVIKRERERFGNNRIEDDAPSPLEDLSEQSTTENPDEQIWIKELFDKLTPLEREILHKHCWEGKSLTEISEDFKGTPDQMSKTTVDRRLKDIQKKLRQIIKKNKP